MDEGGPRREYFRLVLAEIGNNNSLFDWDPQIRILRMELAGNSYLIVGRNILIYGGPAPSLGQLPNMFLGSLPIQ